VKPNTPFSEQYQSTIQSIMRLLNQQRIDEAVSACLAFLESNPESNDPLLLLARARQMQGRSEDMLTLVERALARDPRNIGLQLQFVGACLFCGYHDRAIAQLEQAERMAGNNPDLLQKIAQRYLLAVKHQHAHRCYLRAAKLDGDNPQYLNNLALSYMFMGDLRRAEEVFSAVIARAPDHYDAWHNRSTLRKQSPRSNHIRKLEKALGKLSPNEAGEVPLCYALAKEYEDLGKDKRSFFYLKRGADRCRRGMRYDVQTDVALMKRIAELFDRHWAKSAKTAKEQVGPIFVMGLPRSGTTLVDRIIGSHSKVESMGEISDFAQTLNRIGGSVDPDHLLEKSLGIDPDQYGQRYLRSVAGYGFNTTYFIDKTPTNYLYIGLIAKALPGASIVHLRRNPVDSCFSLYRTLFRAGNPFSYNLRELAEYYIGYDALMTHWRLAFPDLILDVSYEELVDNQEHVSRDIIAHCGLDWEPACLEFDKSRSPVSSASAAQVRQPMYREAVARWKRFEDQLAPLITRLLEADIAF
jgi:tetratricopeptide (TPR) repeat protein